MDMSVDMIQLAAVPYHRQAMQLGERYLHGASSLLPTPTRRVYIFRSREVHTHNKSSQLIRRLEETCGFNV